MKGEGKAGVRDRIGTGKGGGVEEHGGWGRRGADSRGKDRWERRCGWKGKGCIGRGAGRSGDMCGWEGIGGVRGMAYGIDGGG